MFCDTEGGQYTGEARLGWFTVQGQFLPLRVSHRIKKTQTDLVLCGGIGCEREQWKEETEGAYERLALLVGWTTNDIELSVRQNLDALSMSLD